MSMVDDEMIHRELEFTCTDADAGGMRVAGAVGRLHADIAVDPLVAGLPIVALTNDGFH